MKILISVPNDLVARVDTWCEAHSTKSRSHFFRLLAHAYFGNTAQTPLGMDYVSPAAVSQEPVILSKEPECEVRLCQSLASGRYKIMTPDFEAEQYLCKFHLNIAKREAKIFQLN